MTRNGMRPIHPGEVLREDYLKPMDMSANALARHLHVPASRVNDIVLERRGITADTALRLSRFFGGDAPWSALLFMPSSFRALPLTATPSGPSGAVSAIRYFCALPSLRPGVCQNQSSAAISFGPQ